MDIRQLLKPYILSLLILILFCVQFDTKKLTFSFKLSHAGFYFNPSKTSPDNVTCFLCHKSMEGWSPNDDPFDEHFTHAPDCAWAICRCVKREFNNNELPFSWNNEDQWPTSKNMEEIRLKTFGNWWPHEGKKGWVGTSRKVF
jgi:hypothetical protein